MKITLLLIFISANSVAMELNPLRKEAHSIYLPDRDIELCPSDEDEELSKMAAHFYFETTDETLINSLIPHIKPLLKEVRESNDGTIDALKKMSAQKRHKRRMKRLSNRELSDSIRNIVYVALLESAKENNEKLEVIREKDSQRSTKIRAALIGGCSAITAASITALTTYLFQSSK